jgi:hypothetical protein
MTTADSELARDDQSMARRFVRMRDFAGCCELRKSPEHMQSLFHGQAQVTCFTTLS